MKPHGIEPELLQPTPRWVRRSPTVPRAAISLGIIGVLAVGLWFACGAAAVAAVGRAVWSVDVTGLVTQVTDEGLKQAGGRYSLDFSYTLAGREYDGWVRFLYDKDWPRPRLGDEVEVRLFPPMPGRNPRLAAAKPDDDRAVLGLTVLGCVILGAAFWITVVIPTRHKHLIRHGRVGTGRVTHTAKREGKSRRKFVVVTYLYTVSESSFAGNFERDGHPPTDAVGDAVTVLYDPANPGRHVAYAGADYVAVP